MQDVSQNGAKRVKEVQLDLFQRTKLLGSTRSLAGRPQSKSQGQISSCIAQHHTTVCMCMIVAAFPTLTAYLSSVKESNSRRGDCHRDSMHS